MEAAGGKETITAGRFHEQAGKWSGSYVGNHYSFSIGRSYERAGRI